MRFTAETRGYFRYNIILPPTGWFPPPSSLPQRPYGDFVTKFSGIGGFPFSLRYGAARSRKLRCEMLFSRGDKQKCISSHRRVISSIYLTHSFVP